ncbi:MAG TPA: EamA family transporter [Opitutaceae bacterium]|nr:EamA family transporter [Opitutaceae bacterium]
MTPKSAGILLVLAAVIVESFAQLSLKVGASGRPGPAAGLLGRLAAGRRAGFPPAAWIAAGVALYVIEIVLYTLALHRLEVSVAFPLGSLCFVGVALLSRLLLAERVGTVRWLGVCCIIVGTVFTAL